VAVWSGELAGRPGERERVDPASALDEVEDASRYRPVNTIANQAMMITAITAIRRNVGTM
jgi:hypothetical protein